MSIEKRYVNIYIIDCIYTTLRHIDAYISSEEFSPLWKGWGAMYARDERIRNIVMASFRLKTLSTTAFCQEMYKMIIALLNMIKLLHVLDYGTYASLNTPKMSTMFMYMFYTSNNTLRTLYDNVCKEYEPFIVAALKIQRSWRRVMYNPSYAIGKRQLKMKFQEHWAHALRGL